MEQERQPFSTCFTGVYKPDMGQIFLDGKNITGLSTIEINKAGISENIPEYQAV